MQNTILTKDKIISLIQIRGPSLPVHVSKEIQQSTLFSSAFLSELLSEKRLKMSQMKVGGSPLYFIVGQEPQLERFAHHLKSREKDAFELLKEKKFLKDKDQEPAIRVALRYIKDFAIPFKSNEEIFWKYFTVPFSDFKESVLNKEEKIKIEEPKEERKIIPEKKVEIFDKKPKKEIKKPAKRKATNPQKKNEQFFNIIKEHLAKKSIEISDILGFNKTDLFLIVEEIGVKKLLVAYNKKRITEKDVIDAHKKALEYNLNYMVYSLGEPTKTIQNLIEAIKNLNKLEKI